MIRMDDPWEIDGVGAETLEIVVDIFKSGSTETMLLLQTKPNHPTTNPIDLPCTRPEMSKKRVVHAFIMWAS